MARETALPATLPGDLRLRLRQLAVRGWQREVTSIPNADAASDLPFLSVTLSKGTWCAIAHGPAVAAITAAIEQAENCEREPGLLLADRIERWWRGPAGGDV